MKIEESIGLFLQYIATDRRMSVNTQNAYDHDLRDLCDYLSQQEIYTLDELEARDIRAWQMMHTEKGERPASVKRYLAAVSSWLRFLRRRKLMERDLMAKITMPKIPKRQPVFYRQSEAEHLYDEGIFADDFYGRRDSLAMRMLYETGVRRSELTGLREGDVDLSARTVKVLGKGNKERYIPIEEELCATIAVYLPLKHEAKPGNPWMFPGTHTEKLSDQMLYTIVRKKMTTLSNADRTSPHVFRHSFATHILSEGGDLKAISQLLGHANLAATELYTHVTREHLKETYRNAHPRGRNKE